MANGSLGDFTIVTGNYGLNGNSPDVEVATPFMDAGCLPSKYITLNDAAYPRNAPYETDPYGQYSYSEYPGNITPINASGQQVYLKLLITLERTTPCSTCQDIVLLQSYPIGETILTNAPPGSNPGVTDPYPYDDPATLYGPLPSCTPGVLPAPASSARIADFCSNNPRYNDATRLRVAGTSPANAATSVTHANNQALTQFACYPNPVAGKATIQFASVSDGHVKVELFNMVGERVKTIGEDTYPAGLHELTFDTNGLAAGLYTCILQTETKREIIKVSIIK